MLAMTKFSSPAMAMSGTPRPAKATSLVSEGLEAQRQSISGVNIDEEAIDLIRYQRAFQGSARFITVIDELMGTVINLLR